MDYGNIIIDGERLHIDVIYTDVGGLPLITTSNGYEYYVAESHESAGKAARERWRDMAQNDRREFVCIIGEERLVGWALGESDSYGISSLEQFLDVTETVPEEEFASYDDKECEIAPRGRGKDDADGATVCQAACDALGFMPRVAYRHN